MADATPTTPTTTKGSTASVKNPSATSLSVVRVSSAYEQSLDLPVAIVLGVMWLLGVALMGSCALLLYLAVSALI